MFWFHTFLCFVLFPVAVSVQRHDPEWDDPNRSTQFAVLVTGNSDTFDRGYMSQGSVAHAFHLFRNSGIPPHHITSLSPGNAPSDTRTNCMEALFNWPSCTAIDLLPGFNNNNTEGIDVTASSMLRALSFTSAIEGKSSIPKAGDTIFHYMVGKGAPGLLEAADTDITKYDIHYILYMLASNFPGVQVLWLVDCNRSGGLFEDIVFNETVEFFGNRYPHNITVITATRSDQISMRIPTSMTPLDEWGRGHRWESAFSHYWMEFVETQDLQQKTLGDFFNYVRINVQNSNVQIFGRTDPGTMSTRMRTFFGPRKPKVIRLHMDPFLYCVCDAPNKENLVGFYGHDCHAWLYKDKTTIIPNWTPDPDVAAYNMTDPYPFDYSTTYDCVRRLEEGDPSSEVAECKRIHVDNSTNDDTYYAVFPIKGNSNDTEWKNQMLNEYGSMKYGHTVKEFRQSFLSYYNQHPDAFVGIPEEKRELKMLELFSRSIRGKQREKWLQLYEEEQELEATIDAFFLQLNRTVDVFTSLPKTENWECYLKAVKQFEKRFGSNSYGHSKYDYLANLCTLDPNGYQLVYGCLLR